MVFTSPTEIIFSPTGTTPALACCTSSTWPVTGASTVTGCPGCAVPEPFGPISCARAASSSARRWSTIFCATTIAERRVSCSIRYWLIERWAVTPAAAKSR